MSPTCRLSSVARISITLLLINQLLVSLKMTNGHIVLTRDDFSQSLVLTGDDGGGKDGKGGKGGGGDDQLVIAGNQMGGEGQNSRMVMQDAANREGDIVMNGKSMIIPGEDGHIVLADSRSQNDQQRSSPSPFNPMLLWAPYMNNRYFYRMMMPYLG